MPRASTDSSDRRLFTYGSAMTAAMADEIRSMVAGGVAAGAKTPFQVVT